MNTGRIACILADGFEDTEFAKPYRRLLKEGYEVDVIGARRSTELAGAHGKESIRTNLSIDDADPDAYDGLLIPGGRSPDTLRADPRFVDFVRAFDALRRPIAAICHGPQILLTAGLVKGRTLTAWQTVQGDLRHAGAHVRDEEVIVDGNWTTSRKPEDVDAFIAKFLEELLEDLQRGTAGRRHRRARSEQQLAHDALPPGEGLLGAQTESSTRGLH
jgi:protease I